MKPIRVFIAITIPSQITEELAYLQDELRQANAHVSWIKPENMHITLKFLGDMDVQLIDSIEFAIHTCVKDKSPFEVTIGKIGAFPNFRSPKIIWIGAEASHQLSMLANNIDNAMHNYGFEKEIRTFQAHLTLGRVKSMRNIKAVVDLLSQQLDFQAGKFIADEIVLMKSELNSSGAIYTPLKTIKIL